MASIQDLQAAVTALQTTASKTQDDVARLLKDFQNQPTPAELDTILVNVNAVTAQLQKVSDDVNAVDPAPVA